MGLIWKYPVTGENNPGGGNSERHFGGRRSIKVGRLIREDLQNHFDARRDFSAPVVVRYHFQTLSKSVVDKYFPKQFQKKFINAEAGHLDGVDGEARGDEFRRVFQERHVKVLVIEDFNTTGLNGPVNMKHIYKDRTHPLFHPTNSLTCFLRRSGKSGKNPEAALALGSAGLGRHTYYLSSRIFSKLVLSEPTDLFERVRGGDGSEELAELDSLPFFFGQSYQKERAYTEPDGRQCVASRYCFLADDPWEEDPNRLYTPFGLGPCSDGIPIVERARHDFRLTREPGQQGTSIIIPFVLDNFSKESIIDAVVREFSIPIMDGALVVHVEDIEVSSANIEDLSSDRNVNAYNRFLKAARQSDIDLELALDPDGIGPLSQDLFDEMKFGTGLERYLAGEIVRLDLKVHYGGGQGMVKVAVQKCRDGEKGKRVVARQGLILSKYSLQRFTSSPRMFTWVVDDELGTMLSIIEEPSHTKWVEGDIPENQCSPEIAKRLVDMIRHVAGYLVHLFEGARQEVDEDLFADLLPRHGDNNLKPPPPPRGPRPFRLGLNGGSTMTLKVNPDFLVQGESLDTTAWRLMVVYDSVKGKKFAQGAYRLGSFSMEGAKVSSKGCDILGVGDCHIDIHVTNSADLKVKVGPVQFDDWADLIVEAVRLNVAGGA